MGARYTTDQAAKQNIVEPDNRFKKPRITTEQVKEKLILEEIQGKTAVAQKPGKYRSKKTVVGSITFDSAKEGKRWQELCLLEKTGEIKGLKRQVSLILEVNGEKICGFRPDFGYTDTSTGKQVYEDVKGYRDARHGAYAIFRIKCKLFRALYGFDIVET